MSQGNFRLSVPQPTSTIKDQGIVTTEGKALKSHERAYNHWLGASAYRSSQVRSQEVYQSADGTAFNIYAGDLVFGYSLNDGQRLGRAMVPGWVAGPQRYVFSVLNGMPRSQDIMFMGVASEQALYHDPPQKVLSINMEGTQTIHVNSNEMPELDGSNINTSSGKMDGRLRPVLVPLRAYNTELTDMGGAGRPTQFVSGVGQWMAEFNESLEELKQKVIVNQNNAAGWTDANMTDFIVNLADDSELRVQVNRDVVETYRENLRGNGDVEQLSDTQLKTVLDKFLSSIYAGIIDTRSDRDASYFKSHIITAFILFTNLVKNSNLPHTLEWHTKAMLAFQRLSFASMKNQWLKYSGRTVGLVLKDVTSGNSFVDVFIGRA